MAFSDYNESASLNTNIGGKYTGENMQRGDVDAVLRQLAADGKSLTIAIKARERISLADYGGADPTGATVSDGAVLAAMTAGLDKFANDTSYWHDGPGQPYDVNYTGADRRTIEIHVPAGHWKVTDKIFSRLSHPRAPFVGFVFRGEGGESSVFELQTGGVESWFYKSDNGATESNFQRLTFYNIGFRSDNYQFGNLVNMYSEGGPKQLGFYFCHFWNLQKCLETRGTGNADLNVFAFCRGEFYGDILTLNNDQSVQHDFINCHFGTYGNVVNVKQFGGGNVNFTNSSMDFVWHEDFSPAGGNFFFTHDSNANIGQGNCTFTFRNLRVEVEAYKRTAGAPPFGLVNTTAAPNTAFARILFDNVNFVNGRTYTINAGGAITSSEWRRITAVILKADKYVAFGNCVLIKNFFYVVGGDSRDGPAQGGILVFDGCYDGINTELPAADAALKNLHARVIKSGTCGRVITKNMTSHTGGNSFERYLLDYDQFAAQGISYEPSAELKVISFKHPNNAWPFTLNGSNDNYLYIPPNFKARRIYIRKAAAGSSTTPYRLRIGNADKSVVYGSSTTAQFKDEHVIDLSRYDLTGQTVIRLWADDGAGGGTGTDFDNGGVAEVEYI